MKKLAIVFVMLTLSACTDRGNYISCTSDGTLATQSLGPLVDRNLVNVRAFTQNCKIMPDGSFVVTNKSNPSLE